MLITLWDEGKSASQIATALRAFGVACTRNAVIGKAHRLGLAPRPSPIAGRGAAHVLRDTLPAPSPIRRIGATFASYEELANAVHADGVTVLASHHCPTIVGRTKEGETLFCGRPLMPGTWPGLCADCHEVLVAKPKERSPEKQKADERRRRAAAERGLRERRAFFFGT